MAEIEPITTPAPAAIAPAPAPKNAVHKPATPRPPAAAAATEQADMPTMAELLARVSKLETEKAAAQEEAAGYKSQFETLRERGPLQLSMATTTSKPTLRFTVSGPMGEQTFEVVDESEAKRLYCCKYQIDPSQFTLKVACEDQEQRNALITEQYVEAGADTRRMPGVVLAGQARTNRRAAARPASSV